MTFLLRLILVFITSVIFGSCEPDSIAVSEEISITHSSICHCAEYQETTKHINEKEIQKSKLSLNHTAEDLDCIAKITRNDWQKVLNNLNVDEFFDLPDTIGCPNCRDEGAQLLTIAIEPSEHTVVWSNDNELKSMSVLLEILQDLDHKYFSQTTCK